MAARPKLHILAKRMGILDSYRDADGKRHATSAGTRVALLAAMRLDASTERKAAEALESLNRQETTRLLPPVLVAHRNVPDSNRLCLRLPSAEGGRADWALELREENGTLHRWEGRGAFRAARSGEGQGHMLLRLPITPDLGYHDLRVTVRRGSDEYSSEQVRIVVPSVCHSIGRTLRGTRPFGLCANLYSLRSRKNWGVGDFGDLAELSRWAGELGAAFVAVNPLHALRNQGCFISPYSPLSRLYRNVAYLDVSAIPELAECPAARGRIASAEFQEQWRRLKQSPRIEYERVLALKRSVLEPLYDTFVAAHGRFDTARGAAYSAFVAREGEELTHFATFMALDEHFAASAGGPRARQTGPWAFWRPDSKEVEALRHQHSRAIDFHRFLQFELERQLALVADASRSAGLGLGLCQDLALGTSARGSDVWAHPDLFVEGASIGAPPDDYARQGQDWDLPPLNPSSLRDDGYRYWTRLLRAAMTHSGALRIDHVMGLLRQFWIPKGLPASQGTYVSYPWDDLAGILALASKRRRVVIIGEDLGTVPEGFSKRLARWGIVSSRVLFFERNRDRSFRPASRYSKRAFVSATTHDFGPLRGFWEGHDLALRRRTGVIAARRDFERAQASREKDRQRLLKRLIAECVLAPETSPTYPQLCSAVHSFLRRTPAPLVGIMLDDLAGETEPVNLPGVAPKKFKSWERPMTVSLEDLRAQGDIHERLG